MAGLQYKHGFNWVRKRNGRFTIPGRFSIQVGGASGKEAAGQCRRRKRDVGLIPVSGRSPGAGTTTHSSIPVWSIPWTEEPGGLQSMGSRRAGHG